MLAAVRSREHAAAAWASAIFAVTGLLDGFLKIQLIQGPLIGYWAFDVMKWLVLPALLMFAVHRAARVAPRDYGLAADLGARDILSVMPVPLFILFLVGWFTGNIANAMLGYPKPPFSNQEMLSVLGPLWIVGTLYFSVTAGFWESIFLIGLPWLWFSQGRRMPAHSIRIFCLVSALIFAAGHWENGLPNVISVFAFQLCAVWWFVRLQTLWPIIGAHTLIDVYYFWPA